MEGLRYRESLLQALLYDSAVVYLSISSLGRVESGKSCSLVFPKYSKETPIIIINIRKYQNLILATGEYVCVLASGPLRPANAILY